MEKRETSCGTIIVRKIGKLRYILLIRNKSGRHWSFPKGHVEIGETEEQTALRETREETGLEVSIRGDVEPVRVTYSPQKGVTKEVFYFLADYTHGDVQIQKEEISEFKWCEFTEAAKLITFDNEANALLALTTYIME
ncbi:MAG: NUDIX domain-containing protein [Clostridiales bacterium]|jgi:bis(5'-nucleosidyl)-tetraphosphatase|nr:NUDIX domain-containing protein [Clostridiales bacterium]